MPIDKDKPWTWIKYRDGMCSTCTAGCCTMPVEVHASDLVRLNLTSIDEVEASPKKVAKQLMKQGIISSYREKTSFFMLTQRPNGDCYYLHPQTRLCQVYDKRPDVCRKFPEIGPKPGYCPCTKKR